MTPNEKLYRRAKLRVGKGASIATACEVLGLKPHVYAYWRSKEGSLPKKVTKTAKPKIARFNIESPFSAPTTGQVTITGSPSALAAFFSGVKGATE